LKPPATAGELRQRFEIQKNTPVRGTTGEPVDAWSTIDEIWGKIEQAKGQERWMSPQVTATAFFKITVRYHPEINVARQLKMGDRIFDINEVNNVEERNRWMVLTAQELQEPTR
jgi:SPP1 family predicted phage head-tail adaptor